MNQLKALWIIICYIIQGAKILFVTNDRFSQNILLPHFYTKNGKTGRYYVQLTNNLFIMVHGKFDYDIVKVLITQK